MLDSGVWGVVVLLCSIVAGIIGFAMGCDYTENGGR